MICWCPRCGIVWWADDEPPICRHGIHPLDPGSIHHPPARMEPLPAYHPFANDIESWGRQ